MQLVSKVPKRRSDAARALADRRYHHRIVRDKKKYSRKGRASSMRKFEDSIQSGNPAWLTESRRLIMYLLKASLTTLGGAIAVWITDSSYTAYSAQIHAAPLMYRSIWVCYYVVFAGITLSGAYHTIRGLFWQSA